MLSLTPEVHGTCRRNFSFPSLIQYLLFGFRVTLPIHLGSIFFRIPEMVKGYRELGSFLGAIMMGRTSYELERGRKRGCNSDCRVSRLEKWIRVVRVGGEVDRGR